MYVQINLCMFTEEYDTTVNNKDKIISKKKKC